ncbi:MAG TPA: hypothetical protein VFB63_19135 [Bryobacteraceae bacterium]|nr:hypothetical protein [Bryobacteraceae bacterium]
MLLSSLGRLVRGLSALFWGLPIALVVCVQTAKTDLLKPLGLVPSIMALALLYYALTQISYFQKQERVWRVALDRAKIFGLINLGLCPFLYWWNRMPSNPFFTAVIELMAVNSMIYLFCINLLLRRLAAMLPDETLRLETRLFTQMNNYLIGFTALIFVTYLILALVRADSITLYFLALFNRGGLWTTLFMIFLPIALILLPVAMTMALIWKIKELILASVFNADAGTA